MRPALRVRSVYQLFVGDLLHLAWSVTFFSYYLIAALASARSDTNADNIAMLESKLAGYDIKLRPNFGGPPLAVDMQVIVSSVDSISEVNMDYTVTMYLNQFWKDDRLQFTDKSWDFTLPGEFAKRIWVPDTCVANDKQAFLHDVTEQNTLIRLRGDGSITYGMRLTMTLSCMMDLHYYPLDNQNCTIELESYGYPTEDLIMRWRNISAIQGWNRLEMPQFTLVGVSNLSKIAKTNTGSYQRLSLSFRISRNIGYFVYQTYLPSILIVMLSWISFWINYEATSARVALGITTVLTMTTISTGVRSSLPRISYVKAIDVYLVMCFVFVFAALLEYAAVNFTFWTARTRQKLELYEKMHHLERQQRQQGQQNLLAHLATCAAHEKDERPRYSCTSSCGSSPGRLSPLASLRKKWTSTADISGGFPNAPDAPSCAIDQHYGHVTKTITYSCKGYAGYSTSRHRFLASIRRRRKSPSRWRLFRVCRPNKSAQSECFKISDVQKVDQLSRIIFPTTFILFNVVYWSCYGLSGNLLLSVSTLAN